MNLKSFFKKMAADRQRLKETKKIIDGVPRTFFFLKKFNLVEEKMATHPVEKTEHETFFVPEHIPDSKEWDYILSLSKYECYKAIVDLFDHSEKLGKKALKYYNKMGHSSPITKDGLYQHFVHHKVAVMDQEKEVDKEKIRKMLEIIDESKI